MSNRTSSQASQSGGELKAAVAACRAALTGVALASGVVNVLSLTGPLFMLQVYDRILPSRSVESLAGLALIALILFAFQGALEVLRARMLTRIGRVLEARLGRRTFEAVLATSLHGSPQEAEQRAQAFRDLDNVRSFTSSPGLSALFDLPWTPVYVAVCFLFHPWIGMAVLGGCLILAGLMVYTDIATRPALQRSLSQHQERQQLSATAHRNAGVIHALGMRGRIAGLWASKSGAYLDSQQSAADVTAGLGGLSRTIRIILQSGVLALCALLVIDQQATGGVMLAATVMTVRAMTPVDLVIAHWRAMNAARGGWKRLKEMLASAPAGLREVALPPPARVLKVTSLSVTTPGGDLVLHDVSFSLAAGSCLGVVGPSGSGKSTLARALVGIWPAARGVVRLDGATFADWGGDALGRHLGYLPQEVDLLPGTVAQNIARHDPAMDTQAMLRASALAGVHAMALALPDGYDTQVGESGHALSGGQRQRIALARALYGDPFLVVLDEPNANLDLAGEKALAQAILEVRRRGGIVVVVTHRPGVLAAASHILVLSGGRLQALGDAATLLPRLFPAAQASAPAAEDTALPGDAKGATATPAQGTPAKAAPAKAARPRSGKSRAGGAKGADTAKEAPDAGKK
ncbi:MAG: type I secretion system permease/ATPase [Pseudomonadota bacterium]